MIDIDAVSGSVAWKCILLFGSICSPVLYGIGLASSIEQSVAIK